MPLAADAMVFNITLQQASVLMFMAMDSEQMHCWLHFSLQLKSLAIQSQHLSEHFSQQSIGPTFH